MAVVLRLGEEEKQAVLEGVKGVKLLGRGDELEEVREGLQGAVAFKVKVAVVHLNRLIEQSKWLRGC